jgi:large subunit ribosomal protein L9
MEIILRERIDSLGVRGDVVNVSPGYARNYLLPKKLAVLATPANMKQIEQEKAAAVRREALERKDADALAQQLSQVAIQVNRKVGENEVLYGSVTAMDIAELLVAKGFTIDRRKLFYHPDGYRYRVTLEARVDSLRETLRRIKESGSRFEMIYDF